MRKKQKLFAVIDTNVIVSALLDWESIPGAIVEEAVSGRIIPVLSDEILAEYAEVLHRKKFPFREDSINFVLGEMKIRGFFLNPQNSAINYDDMPDKEDIIFYAVTMEIRQDEDDAYLVTGNLKHFPSRPFIVTPREMFDILQN